MAGAVVGREVAVCAGANHLLDEVGLRALVGTPTVIREDPINILKIRHRNEVSTLTRLLYRNGHFNCNI